MEPQHPHHRSARERQRRGPMWTFMRRLVIVMFAGVALLTLFIGGGWWYLGSTSFADLVRLRIVKTLEARLGRSVQIKDVVIVRSQLGQVVINDLRIANPPGSSTPYFATVKQLVISGGIDSFWGRKIKVGRIDIIEPHLEFEIYPAGSPLVHNFPQWQSAPKSKYEIYHLDLGMMYVTRGTLDFVDRKHNVVANAANMSSQINVTSAEDLYSGVMSSEIVRMRIQDYVPFDLDLRGQFRFTPNTLDLQSVAMRGEGLAVFLRGKISPLADAVYNLHITSEAALPKVKQIFRVNKPLDGVVALDGMLRGRAGNFTLDGQWRSAKLKADAYELADARGTMNVTDARAIVNVLTARYAGGGITAKYTLPGYNEPYPQTIDLGYNNISLEKLFSDWTINDTGLRGGATGHLAYHWNKDRLLAGGGEGSATLTKNTIAFSNAKYPIAINGGSSEFSLDNGVVTFKNSAIETEASKIEFSGKLRIEDVSTDLLLRIHSNDFAELDRAGFNFAHSAGKKNYTLLGLGGAGDISGNVQGKIKQAQIVAHIAAAGTKYNNILLGDSDIDLKYDGVKSVMTFEKASFKDANGGRLALAGTLTFPDREPSPIFDLAIDATNYPIDRAIAAVNLKFAVNGVGSGRMLITGNPDEGRTQFVNMLIRQKTAELRLNGAINWKPGKGNVVFALDIAARGYPIADIVKFLDLGTVPVSGELTGTLRLEGPKSQLGGAGAVTIRNGEVFGEAVTLANADIAFTNGTMKVTNLNLAGPAGTISGEAQLNMETNQFSYSIKSQSIDLSKVKALSSIAGLFGGKLILNSSGGGTLDQPELVVEATVNQTTLKGLNYPADAPPPQLYIAIRNGRLIVRGSAANVLTIEGDGAVGTDGTLDGLVRIHVTDVAKLAAMSPNTATVPVAGSFTIDLKLGGKMSSLEAIVIDGTVPQFDLKVSEHEFTAPQPLHFSLRDGRIVFDAVTLQRGDTSFSVSGFAEITGAKRLNIDMRGTLEAALFQLFVPGLRADGHIVLAGGVHGTLTKPTLSGTADIQDATLRFTGFPQVLDHIVGRLIFRGDRIEVEAVRVDVGGGKAAIGGFIAVDGLSPKSARITIQGTDVAIRYFEGLTVEGDFNVLVSGDVDRIVVTGDVDVKRALYFKDTDFSAAVLNVVLSRRGVVPIVAASWQDKVALRLHVVAPGTLAVKNNIADVTGSADVDVSGTLGAPVVLGLVTLDEGGKIRFQNIDYALVRGSINFQNPFRIDPYFDITLEARVSGGLSEIESGPIEVTVTLTGTLDRMTPAITSDPPASDISLFSLLGVGNIGGNQSAGPSTFNAALAGKSLLFQSLSRALGSKVLPFADTFTYDPGTLDTTGDPGPKFTFEKRVSNSVRVLVVFATRDSKSKEIIEWQVTSDWATQLTRDEISNELRMEGRFRRRYEGHWTFGRKGRPKLALWAFPSVASEGCESRVASLLCSTLPWTRDSQPATAPAALNDVITQITFHADAQFDTTLLKQYVSLKPGERLTIRGVQSSIKALFGTGDFRDVRVDALPAPGGIAVTFALFLNYRVAEIHFDGARAPQLSRELTFHNGDVYSLNAVDRSAVAIQQFLVRDGYLEATVDPETNFDRGSSAAAVTFHVTRGAQAQVASVVIEGDTAPYTTQQLIDRMRHGPRKSFRLSAARTDAERIKTFLVRNDFRKADVRYLGDTYDAASKLVTLRYHVVTGPKVHVEVAGVPRGAVRGLLPFYKNQAYSEDVIDKAAQDITSSFQERGFFNAAVDTESKMANNVWTTTFNVSPGPHFNLANVTFSGNQKISDKKLTNVVATAPRGGFRTFLLGIFRRPTGVTRKQLSDDRDAIESYYRLEGFSEAKVETPVVTTTGEQMTVDFPLTEGPQTIITAVAIEGNEQASSKKLPKPELKLGNPLNPQTERADVVALQTFYADRGNAEVQVKPREEVSTDKTQAKVTYVIAEGPEIKVDDVIIRGNTYTNTTVVRRQAQLDKGDPFSYTSILEAQRNLYRLGIFQRVDVQPEQTGTSLATRDVTIAVEEGRDLTVSGSLGMSEALEGSGNRHFVPRVTASIAHRNLFGTGRYLGLEVIAAKGNQQELFLTYREPFIGKWDVPLQFTVFQNDDLRRGAHIRERGGSIEASKIARFQTRWAVRYEYRIADCIVTQEGDLCDRAKSSLIPGLDTKYTNVAISSVTPTFFWDRRDDTLDPHRGFFTTASAEYAFRTFSATAQFLKESAQGSWYLPVTARSTFAVSARVGIIQPLGPSVTVVDPATGEEKTYRSGVPISEKFTAGGETTHRAYPLELLGDICLDPTNPVCVATHTLIPIFGSDGNFIVAPIGGNSMFIANAEYRFPLAGPVGGTLFVDAGNTFAGTMIRFGDLRYGVGGGVRYISPVGPIRFDIGYKLHRQVIGFDAMTHDPIYERPFAYFVTLGYAF